MKPLKQIISAVIIISAICIVLGCPPPGGVLYDDSTDSIAPGDILNLTVIAGEGSLTLKWTNPADEDFDHIEIYYGIDSVDTAFTGTVDPAGTAISGLDIKTPYAVQLFCLDTVGNKSLGVLKNGLYPNINAPADATGLSVDAVGKGSVTLSWTNPSDADLDSIQLYYGKGAADKLYSGTLSSSGTTVTGLTNREEYTFTLKAVDVAGNVSGGTTVKAEPMLYKKILCYEHTTYVIKGDNTLWVAGYNGDNLCINSSTDNENIDSFEMVTDSNGGPLYVRDAYPGAYYHSMIVRQDGTVWGIGNNDTGKLGTGDTTDRDTLVQVKTAENTPITDIVSVALGYHHSVLLKDDGTVWCCGDDYYGQLCQGTTLTEYHYAVQAKNADGSFITDAAAVFAGYYYTYILRTDGTLWAAGSNSIANLGDGTLTDRTLPVQVKIDESTYMTDVKSVSSSEGLTWFLLEDGTAYACGYNSEGQLSNGLTGSENHTSASTPYTPTPVLSSASTPFTGIEKIDVGYDHVVLLKTDGTAWTVGSNSNSQLGIGTPDPTPSNSSYPLPVTGTPVSNVADIAAGMTTTYFIMNDDTVWAAGYEEYAEFGNGGGAATSDTEQTPVEIMIPDTP